MHRRLSVIVFPNQFVDSRLKTCWCESQLDRPNVASRGFAEIVFLGFSLAFSSWRVFFAVVIAVAWGYGTRGSADEGTASPQPVAQTAFADVIQPFLSSHCGMCHGESEAEGGVQFNDLAGGDALRANTDLWEAVIRVVSEQQMPPPDQPQPTGEELASFVQAVKAELAAIDCTSVRAPGRVTLRRLNRVEYNNTVRDLLGVDFRPADDFPADDVGNGFDNIGDVLSLPTLLMEKYLAAAEQISDRVWGDEQLRLRFMPELPTDQLARLMTVMKAYREFVEKAFRRPVTDEEFASLFRVLEGAHAEGANEEQLFKLSIQLVLVSPQFLFRVEADNESDFVEGIRPLNDWEIATRLAYFLWSSMPDEALRADAAKGTLRDPQVLSAQVDRMLADDKAQALVDNFAGQWLQLRELSRLAPDAELFPQFDDGLRQSMRRETELFFLTLLRENRSIMEFLNADFTFVDERLAKHYGIEGVTGGEFRRVPASSGRKGVLTQASILLLTSNPTRTSPVKRGKWVLENILDEPPPPPPAGVEELEEGAQVLGTLRERMEQHRSNPTCASCHMRMDTIGFGLENFDPVGAWRSEDGKQPINPAGELGAGMEFSTPNELMDILLAQKSDAFARCLTKKLLTYALGRGVTSSDRCAVNQIMAENQADGYRFQSLIKAIVLSDPFLYRQAKDSL